MRASDILKTAAVTSCGLGYAPLAPGTFGALAGAAIFAAVRLFAPTHETLILAAALLLACALSIWAGPWAEERFGRKDPKHFVLDETVGYLLVVLLFPGRPFWSTLIAAFITARLFDVIKPPPARWLERLPHGWGVLLDDLAASLYAALTLHLAAWLSPSCFLR